MLILAFLLFILALVLLWLVGRRQKTLGLPTGRIISADMRTWGAAEETLVDPILGLTGRPDYLVKQGNQLIPVEVKTRRVNDVPYDSHIIQLAAYCRLVERHYGQRPAYGILHYANRTFAINYTPELEANLNEALKKMRDADQRKDVLRSHESPARCRACGYRLVCDQSLA
jgi:CRISPR-associated exonuclease Cas4